MSTPRTKKATKQTPLERLADKIEVEIYDEPQLKVVTSTKEPELLQNMGWAERSKRAKDRRQRQADEAKKENR